MPSSLAARRAARSAGQAASVTLTSAPSAAAPTKVEFDKVVADLAALRTALRNAGLMA
jgi:hypothetical protein